jgi:hypothetical protein
MAQARPWCATERRIVAEKSQAKMVFSGWLAAQSSGSTGSSRTAVDQSCPTWFETALRIDWPCCSVPTTHHQVMHYRDDRSRLRVTTHADCALVVVSLFVELRYAWSSDAVGDPAVRLPASGGEGSAGSS